MSLTPGEKRRKARRVGDGGHPWTSYLRDVFKSHIPRACYNREVSTEPEDRPRIHSVHSFIHSFNRHLLCPYDV